MRRLIARMLHEQRPVCFACGRAGAAPCPGHEYGGMITGWRRRRFAPAWLAGRVDCRWTLPKRDVDRVTGQHGRVRRPGARGRHRNGTT